MRRGNKLYEPPRYMSIPTAISQLIFTETVRKSGVLSPAETLAISVSRIGGGIKETIIAGTLEQLSKLPEDVYGDPLHSLVIVGKRLHDLEVDYSSEFAVDEKVWRDVARSAYGCS